MKRRAAKFPSAVLAVPLLFSVAIAANKPADLIARGGSAGRRLSTARPAKLDNRWNVYLRGDQVVVEAELNSSGDTVHQNFLFSQNGVPAGYAFESVSPDGRKQSMQCSYGSEMKCTTGGAESKTFKAPTPQPAIFFTAGAEVDYLWTMVTAAAFTTDADRCKVVATFDLPGDDQEESPMHSDDSIKICRAGATSAYTPKGRIPAIEYVFNGAIEGKLWVATNGLPVHLEMQDVAFESEGQLTGGRKKLFLDREPGVAAPAAAAAPAAH